METFQGYFVEQNRFIPTGTIRIPLRRRTIVTVLDEPAEEEGQSNEVRERLELFEMANAIIDESPDEEVPDFLRADLHREVDI